MALTNQQLLTRGDKKYANKKKAKLSGVQKVSYDPKAREEYLTGFHKRKLQRKEEGKKKAEEYIRKQKSEEKRAASVDKKLAIKRGLDKLEEAQRIFHGVKPSNGSDAEEEPTGSHSDEEFSGFSDSSGILKKTQFEDEEVTIEEVRVDPYVDMSRNDEVLEDSTRKAQEYAKYVESLEAPKKVRKPKKKKFRYLSKTERLAERKKQRA